MGKEDELKQLKSELAALERKRTAELVPDHDENDGTLNKMEQSQVTKTEEKLPLIDSPSASQPYKSSMVAEPYPRYQTSIGTYH